MLAVPSSAFCEIHVIDLIWVLREYRIADVHMRETSAWSPFSRVHLEPLDENHDGGRPSLTNGSKFISDAAWAR